ncbi:alpha/beta fold hydrolase [Jatrophihabitans sp.]|uniref:alpha/beta fold hydrolase n=1 Tax=Jatrophihabitans sp. TaxID=1932789 RepID=UPI002C5221B9|nr:alpha/beta hydrolase [Jatrophihabitans sp.]
MSSTRVMSVPVPGARLHCEVTGSGPVLLLIAGAAGDASTLAPLASRLSAKYQAVTYDMRGLSRSVLDGPAADTDIELLADDAYRILTALGSEPGYVFGTSGGGLVALELTARHPDLVRTLIAHEPAATALLPHPQQWLDFLDELTELYRQHGAGVAMGRFLDGIEAVPGPGTSRLGELSLPPAGQASDESRMSPRTRALMRRAQTNMDQFFTHHIRQAARYRPDVEALGRATSRIVIGVGEASVGQAAYQAALEVAGRLGLGVVELPGDHLGYATQPAEFAAAVEQLLAAG